MPSELDLQLTRAMVFVNNFAIRALIETHPDRAALQRVFLHYVNQYRENVAKERGDDDPHLRLIRLHADELLGSLY